MSTMIHTHEMTYDLEAAVSEAFACSLGDGASMTLTATAAVVTVTEPGDALDGTTTIYDLEANGRRAVERDIAAALAAGGSVHVQCANVGEPDVLTVTTIRPKSARS